MTRFIAPNQVIIPKGKRNLIEVQSNTRLIQANEAPHMFLKCLVSVKIASHLPKVVSLYFVHGSLIKSVKHKFLGLYRA